MTTRPSLRTASAGAAGVAALAYANTLGHGFVWDDPVSVQRWLPALTHWWSPFAPPAGIAQFPPDYYRPLQLLSYRLDRALGGGAPFPFHLTAVALHVVATVLVLRTTLRLLPPSPHAAPAALAAALLFAVHPIHSESVAWTGARPDAMVACLGLGALLAYWHAGWSAARRGAVAAALVFAALLCKENAVALVLLVPASVVLVPRLRAGVAPARLAAIAPFAAALLLYLALRAAGVQQSLVAPTSPGNPVLVLVAALGTYLRLLVLPHPQNAYIAEVPTDAAALALAALALAGFAALAWWSWRGDDRTLRFALLWIAVTLAPSLVVILKPPTAPLAERYLYLPSVGLSWASGALALRAFARAGWRRPTQIALALVLLVAFGLTVQRNAVWRDNLSLWSDASARNGIDGLPLRNLATATLARGDAATAARQFEQALALRNTPQGERLIYVNLGTLAVGRGDDASGERYYRKALALGATSDCLYNLGLIELRRAMSAEGDAAAAPAREAQQLLQQASLLNPHDADVQVGLGYAAQLLGDRVAARGHFEEGLRRGLPPQTAAAVRKLVEELK